MCVVNYPGTYVIFPFFCLYMKRSVIAARKIPVNPIRVPKTPNITSLLEYAGLEEGSCNKVVVSMRYVLVGDGAEAGVDWFEVWISDMASPLGAERCKRSKDC